MITRRTVVAGAGGLIAAGVLGAGAEAAPRPRRRETAPGGIDRHALVSRHDVVRTASDPELPLQVGNGRFAFGADVTGLQTFLPFATMSHWGWHSDPLPPGTTLDDYRGTVWDTHGRPVRYWTGDPDNPELNSWLRENPHRINLGRIGMRLLKSDGSAAVEADLTDRHQRLELWTGVLRSSFSLEGVPVTVETACHPDLDALAVRIDSPLVGSGRLTVFVDFPYGPAEGTFSAPFVGVWDQPEAHETTVRTGGAARADITHSIGETSYHVGMAWQPGGRLARDPDRRHRYVLKGEHHRKLELTCLFSPEQPREVPAAAGVVAVATAGWPKFWRSGGAVDLSQSEDPRWTELERRIVLSQYHLAVNEAGDLPPQESGLVNNGWYGKFHMEMYFWHVAHYALWNRWPLLDRSRDVYERFLPSARERAAAQGFRGARWPKMTSPIGRESPGQANALLLWQQPHPMFLAELDYRAHPDRRTLEKWREVLYATADFLASYAFFDTDSGHYVIGPPMMVANERTDPRVTTNPAFELSYWRFGLRIAQEWRTRLGSARNPEWDEVLDGLAPLPVQDGAYVLYEGVENMWTQHNHNHPDPVAPYGMLPGDGVDVLTMRSTAQHVYDHWRVDNLYSWDFPLLAMNAARLGDPDRAVEFLLHPRYRFTGDGFPVSGTGAPTPYFPAAGGLLYAVAMMAAGWADGTGRDTPGFPDDSRWKVRWEGLSPALPGHEMRLATPVRVELDGVDHVSVGETVEVSARFSNTAWDGTSEVRDVEVELHVPDEWMVTPRTPDPYSAVGPGETVETTWAVTRTAAGGFGVFSLQALATYADPARGERVGIVSGAVEFTDPSVITPDDVEVLGPAGLGPVVAGEGIRCYVDRDFEITNLPAALVGGVLIPGANDDKRAQEPEDYLVFDVALDATVYVAFDARGLDSWWPSWLLDGFEPTGMTIGTADATLAVFGRDVPAGRVTLGPNSATTGNSSSYITLLTAYER